MARAWGIPPSDVWAMTVSEIAHEYEWRRPHMATDYAGGMTEGEIEAIKDESAALRARIEAKRNGS
ncbi:MAG: hypothetical protein Tp176DCM1853251_63 [Prokaryotic dsDNA virus sp.]|nr:MAG: hypothetical protein Tp176DCM1853251_63 [Prokaryotic dsDNA virus sp.]QDP67242.1 MAG: hypothetical protein GOVbin7368_33 [Prokaryotic dsDNA virus sp.]